MLGKLCGSSWHRPCNRGEFVQARVLGYVVGGFGTGEADEQRRGMLSASLAPLPPTALRMAAGLSTPHQVRPLQLQRMAFLRGDLCRDVQPCHWSCSRSDDTTKNIDV